MHRSKGVGARRRIFVERWPPVPAPEGGAHFILGQRRKASLDQSALASTPHQQQDRGERLHGGTAQAAAACDRDDGTEHGLQFWLLLREGRRGGEGGKKRRSYRCKSGSGAFNGRGRRYAAWGEHRIPEYAEH